MDASSPPRTEPKLAVVVGATGNQGGSVARRFLREPGFRVRGLTRDTDSAASRQLAALGAEMVRVDLLHPEDDENENNDTSSLHAAFRGASVIFSVTSYWEPFAPGGTADDDDEKKKREAAGGESFSSVREYAGHAERTAGRNIADAAAATAGSLDEGGFVASTLSHAGRCSGGRVAALHHFDAKADVFPDYVRDRHPALAAKMKCVQTGFFMASHRILPDSYLAKVPCPPFLPVSNRSIYLPSLTGSTPLSRSPTARGWQLRDAILYGPGKARASPGPRGGLGQFRVCCVSHALSTRPRLHGRGHNVYLAGVDRGLEQGHRGAGEVSTHLVR